MTPVVLTMKVKSMIRNAGTDWSEREIYKPIISVAEDLERSGKTVEEITNAFLSVGLTFANELGGPRELSQRLFVIATRFAADADLADAAARGSADGVIH